jgi:iron complex transport system substrate-binding protein
LAEMELLARKPWWRELPAVRNRRVAVVDGSQMFNRPGPRLVDALEFLVGLIGQRPTLIPTDFPWRSWREP